MKLFAFHGRRNQPLNLGEPGEYNDDIIKPTAGKWIYTNPEAELKVGDIINYWIFIQNNQSRYRKDNLVYEVRGMYNYIYYCNRVLGFFFEFWRNFYLLKIEKTLEANFV